ncbi:3,4-dihydroxy-2-butanone-4-phosphate synthase [Oceanicaulis sp.]|uniref:3,4-dihydroxy-2-butanone-4-phosphate synthase n=1 Tax=Oceanicaulis sp. TaxID=1924941 RepID=UPI003F6FA5AC
MNQIEKTSHFTRETPSDRVRSAIEAVRAGRGVVITDDADRENEGDLVFAAETLTTEQMAQLIRDCSGIVCLVLDPLRAKQLALPPMVRENSARYGTNFTVSIEARDGVSTGVSAADRTRTIKTAIAPDAKPNDLARPGHVFPLVAHPDGLAARRGHTEASLALMALAGRQPSGVLCELMHADGTMMRLEALLAYCDRHGLAWVTVEDLAVVSAE